MKLKLTIVLLFFACALQLKAQIWHAGVLALNNGDHIAGVLNYDFEFNSVQIRYGMGTKTFSASQFYSFQLFETESSSKRDFFVIEYQGENAVRPVPQLFESLYMGKVSLLARSSGLQIPAIALDTREDSPTSRPGTYGHFLYWIDGRIEKLHGGKNSIIKAFGSDRSRIKKYVNRHNFDPTKRQGILNLVIYFNTVILKDSTNQTQRTDL